MSKNLWIEDFYCLDYPRDMVVATKNFILNTNQPIKPINVLKKDYKKVIPYDSFPLDRKEMSLLIPNVLENTYLSNIEEKWSDIMYYFYQFCNAGGINELVYIKDSKTCPVKCTKKDIPNGTLASIKRITGLKF